MSANTLDDHFLPGVWFTLDGETLPARELAWAMYSSCGCVAALHMMTEDTITESAAWKAISGNSQMIKRDTARGFTIKMVKHREVPFDYCTHSPKWGYMRTPIPPAHSWATTDRARCLHLVPLSPTEPDEQKTSEVEWAEDDGTWSAKAASLCGKSTEPIRVWSRKWYRTDGKVECSSCTKIAKTQALL